MRGVKIRSPYEKQHIPSLLICIKSAGPVVSPVQVWSWEPSQCVDYVDVGWSKLADVAVHENKLLGCATHQSSVSLVC